MIARVILATEDSRFRKELEQMLEEPDALVHSVGTASRVWERLSKDSYDLVIVSYSLFSNVRAFADMKSLPDPPAVIVFLPTSDPKLEGELMAEGCEAVLSRQYSSSSIRDTIETILEKREQSVVGAFTTRQLVGEEPRLTDFVSRSPSMRAFMNVVQRVVESDVSLLILGETGVGKERLARAIHAEGPRYAGPFIAVNCGALPESLLESELFGHEKGSFTGATRSRRGCFEMAHKGTVFLDEIGELESHLQVKLLRVLQDREVQRVGGEAPVKVDVRIMAATNHNLEEDIQRGVFRKDLYYRLSVVSLTVPPLRERLEDIPEVVSRYLNYFYSRIERDVTGIQPDALAALMRYSWPGNVRELINVIERAVILCEGHEIKLVDLPETVSGAVRDRLPDDEGFRLKDIREEDLLAMPLRDAKRQVSDLFEKHYLEALLRETNGRIGETARRAGIQPRSLFEKMKQLGLQKEQFRAPHRR